MVSGAASFRSTDGSIATHIDALHKRDAAECGVPFGGAYLQRA